jgi:EAL domain-containing protein (putative c-di-GMP-specific phosphodiesterase class I)
VNESINDGPTGVSRETTALVFSHGVEMESICRQLQANGALGLILVDSAALEVIERHYGVPAYLHCLRNLRLTVLEVCQEHLAPDDVITSGEGGIDEIAIFLFRPRGHDAFYRELLPELTSRLSQVLNGQGARIVYPYDRGTPVLSVGCALSLHNPCLREERQVLETLERARADAALNASIISRERSKSLVDLLLSEDVTTLYEPIVNITTRQVRGYEGLVRGPWGSPLHSPAALFEVAGEVGMLFELDCLCRRIALRGARGLQPGHLLFLNCLPTAIHDPAFRGDVLRRTLEDLRLRPSDVVFEISEKESIRSFEIFREARDYFAELGLKIALDDTGAAYGSLEALMELSPDFIKVDLSLVRSIDTDPPRQELLRALHAVAGKLGAEIIAEGIETSEELATIQSLGIPYGQGYLFGRPAPLRRGV